MLKRIALPKWKIANCQFRAPHCGQRQVLNDSASNARLFSGSIKELITLKSDAHAAWSIREHSPVVVCFAGSRETEG